jgi:uncharacterized protein YbaP (TraB family)
VKAIFKKIVLLVLLGWQPAVAQDSTHESGLLWKITGNGLQQPSYLYGTIHFVPLANFFVSNAVVQAFMSSKILATENAAFMRYIPRQVWREKSQQRFLPGDQTVAAYLSEALENQSIFLQRVPAAETQLPGRGPAGAALPAVHGVRNRLPAHGAAAQ